MLIQACSRFCSTIGIHATTLLHVPTIWNETREHRGPRFSTRVVRAFHVPGLGILEESLVDATGEGTFLLKGPEQRRSGMKRLQVLRASDVAAVALLAQLGSNVACPSGCGYVPKMAHTASKPVIGA